MNAEGFASPRTLKTVSPPSRVRVTLVKGSAFSFLCSDPVTNGSSLARTGAGVSRRRARRFPVTRARSLAPACCLLLLSAAALADDFAGVRRQLLAEADRVASAGPYRPEWESLKTVPIPEWYLDGKFGIFIHWGLYSVPAFGNEWYPRNMYKADTPEFRHHVATFGPQAQFGYKDFIPRFTADKYDPGAWADLFRRAGARFVVPVAEHHDGFAMYDTALSGWSAAKMGPKRDLVGDLARGGAREGARLRALDPPRRALVVLRPGDGVRLGRARRRSGTTSTAPPSRRRRPTARRTSPTAPTSTTGWRGRWSSSRSTARSSCGSTGGSSSRPSSPISAVSPPTTTTRARAGARVSRSTTS